jgi:hypothetical protein
VRCGTAVQRLTLWRSVVGARSPLAKGVPPQHQNRIFAR